MIVLGPCPCRGCGKSVYWDGWHWRDASHEWVHNCRARRSNGRSIGYNSWDGMSVNLDQFDTVRATPAISSSLICGRRSFSGG